MAVVELPIRFDLPAHRYRVTLSGVEFGLRFTFRDRTSSWYLDLFDVDGNPLALGRRLSPGYSPLLGVAVDRGPSGYLLVTGSDPYEREGIRLFYVTDVDAPAALAISATVDP